MDFGDLLIETRKKHNLTLSKVAKDLKIKSCYLEAFEKEKFNEMPADPYASGFLGLYAKYLGLDDIEVLEDYRVKKTALKFAKDHEFKKDIVLKDKVNTFQIWSFWNEQAENIKDNLGFLEKLINIMFWLVGVIALVLFFVLVDTIFSKPSLDEQNIQNFKKREQYCLEILANENVWMSIIADDDMPVSDIVEKDKIIRVFANDYIRLVLGDITKSAVFLNGKQVEISKNSRRNTNNILLNSETISNWIN